MEVCKKQSSYILLTASHGINARKTDDIENTIVDRKKRTSITFRKVRKAEHCFCQYQAQCDSWLTVHKGSFLLLSQR